MRLRIVCQSINILNSFHRSVLLSFSYSVCNGPKPASATSQAAPKERKNEACFVCRLHVWHVKKEKVEDGVNLQRFFCTEAQQEAVTGFQNKNNTFDFWKWSARFFMVPWFIFYNIKCKHKWIKTMTATSSKILYCLSIKGWRDAGANPGWLSHPWAI